MSATINPESILRELTDLWVSLGEHPEKESAAGVLRACTMTLVVAADENDDPANIGETLAALMPEHPSRAIVIRFRSAVDRELGSRVFAQCWMPFGYRQQICCEQIEITASDASLPDVPAVVLPLAVADLPVILWSRSPRLFAMPEFSQLIAIAQKLVLDSAAFPEPRSILAMMAASLAQGRILADLSWTRLTRWRELISQVFENRMYLSRLAGISQIQILFGGDVTPVSAWYLGAWLLEGLQKLGSRPEVSFVPRSGATAGQLERIEFSAGGAIPFSIARTGQAAEVQIEDLTNRTVFPQPTDYTLMREELSIPGRDPVYAKVLPAAARLAAEWRSRP